MIILNTTLQTFVMIFCF